MSWYDKTVTFRLTFVQGFQCIIDYDRLWADSGWQYGELRSAGLLVSECDRARTGQQSRYKTLLSTLLPTCTYCSKFLVLTHVQIIHRYVWLGMWFFCRNLCFYGFKSKMGRCWKQCSPLTDLVSSFFFLCLSHPCSVWNFSHNFIWFALFLFTETNEKGTTY